MLVPGIIDKTKFGIKNGEIVPIGILKVEQLIEYNMDNFTTNELQSLIDAGHIDYFDAFEKEKLNKLGITFTNFEINLVSMSSDFLKINPKESSEMLENFLLECNDNLQSIISDDEIYNILPSNYAIMNYFCFNTNYNFINNSYTINIMDTTSYEDYELVYILMCKNYPDSPECNIIKVINNYSHNIQFILDQNIINWINDDLIFTVILC